MTDFLKHTARSFTLLETTLVLLLMSVLLVAFGNIYFSFSRLRGIPENYLFFLESVETGTDLMTREIRGARGFTVSGNPPTSIAFTDPRGTSNAITYSWSTGAGCAGICVTRQYGAGAPQVLIFPSVINIESFAMSVMSTCPDGSQGCQPKYTFTILAKLPLSNSASIERQFIIGVTPRFLQM